MAPMETAVETVLPESNQMEKERLVYIIVMLL